MIADQNEKGGIKNEDNSTKTCFEIAQFSGFSAFVGFGKA